MFCYTIKIKYEAPVLLEDAKIKVTSGIVNNIEPTHSGAYSADTVCAIEGKGKLNIEESGTLNVTVTNSLTNSSSYGIMALALEVNDTTVNIQLNTSNGKCFSMSLGRYSDDKTHLLYQMLMFQ